MRTKRGGLDRGNKALIISTSAFAAIFATTFLASSLLPSPSSANSSTFTVNIRPVISVRTLDSTATNEISSLDFAITPTPRGTTSSNATVVDVATSNVSGYNLYMNSDYTTATGSKTTALTSSDPNVLVTIPTSIPTDPSSTNYWDYNASWSESIASPGSSSTNNYSGNSGNKLIPTHNSPDTIRSDVSKPIESSKTTVNISVNADSDIPGSIYRNKLVFTATGKPIPVDYSLTFDKNTTDNVTNVPYRRTSSSTSTSTSYTIPDASTMARSGYAFVGWSEDPNTRQGTGSGPDGLYVAGDRFTVVADDPEQPDYSQRGTGSATLYAIWEEVVTFWDITTMQQMTPAVCASVYTPTNVVSMTDENIITLERYNNGDYTVTSDNSSPLVPERTLLDDRDADGTGTKKSYKVRKLADGNCWMVDNLEYDLLALYNNGKRGIGSRNDGSTFEMTDSNLASGVAGYYTTTDNALDYVINPNTKPLTNITRYSYLGNVTGQTEYYYNWTAATAGQGSQSSIVNSAIDGSICPAGWRVPTTHADTTDQNISWGALTNAYLGFTENTPTNTGYQTLEQYPISLYRTAEGLYSGNQFEAQYGSYWSSSGVVDNGYRLKYTTMDVSPLNGFLSKSYGFQLRCVASR